MREAAQIKFERVAREFGKWQAVPEVERSAAPPWWWGVAIEIMNEHDEMPPSLCGLMDIATGTTYAQAASKLMTALASLKRPPPA